MSDFLSTSCVQSYKNQSNSLSSKHLSTPNMKLSQLETESTLWEKRKNSVQREEPENSKSKCDISDHLKTLLKQETQLH